MTQERRSSDAKLPIPDLPMTGTSGMHSASVSQPFALPDEADVSGEVLDLDLDLPPPEELGLGMDLELPPPELEPEPPPPASEPRTPRSGPRGPLSGSHAATRTAPVAKATATPARGTPVQRPRAPAVASHHELDDLDDLDNMDGLDRKNFGFASNAPRAQGVDGPSTGEPRWPTGRTPDGDSLAIDDIEVRVVSGFGKVPDNLLHEPLYAWKVFTGRKALAGQLKLEKTKIADAESARDALLIQFIESTRAILEKEKRLERVLEKVKRIESKAKTRATKLSAVGEKYQKDSAQLSAEAAELNAALARTRALVDKFEQELAPKLEVLKRGDAKHKRIQIEVRNLRAADVRVVAEGRPAVGAPKIAELERAGKAIEPALASARATVQEAESALRGAQAQIKDIDTKLGSVKQRMNAVDAAYAEQFDMRTAGLPDDVREHLQALADAGRTLLECQASCDFESPLIAKIRTADELVLERVTTHETVLRAITSHDEEAFRRGLIIAAVVGGVVLVLVLLWIFSPGAPSGSFDDEQFESRRGLAVEAAHSAA